MSCGKPFVFIESWGKRPRICNWKLRQCWVELSSKGLYKSNFLLQSITSISNQSSIRIRSCQGEISNGRNRNRDIRWRQILLEGWIWGICQLIQFPTHGANIVFMSKLCYLVNLTSLSVPTNKGLPRPHPLLYIQYRQNGICCSLECRQWFRGRNSERIQVRNS